ncbi:MAG: NADPH:quinone reductase [Thermomicrobiales bacterium]|nr:NADPH:quinone reductase [Thermomicrobiales bacterium]
MPSSALDNRTIGRPLVGARPGESSMRALCFHRTGGPEVLGLEDMPRPEARPGKIVVRVAAAGLNAADVLERTGRYIEARSFPAVAGREVAGTVAAVGDGVTGFEPGQRVMGFARGSFADYALTIPSLLFPVPDNLDFVRAAALPLQGLTAYLALTTAGRLQPGETVLVQSAAGGVGLLAIQLARPLGAATVIGTASTGDKRGLIGSLGADAAIDYTGDDFEERVHQLTGHRGADLVLDAVGGDAFCRSLSVLAPLGRLIVYGRSSGEAGRVDTYDLIPRSLSVQGFALQSYFRQPELTARAMGELTRYVTTGQLELVIAGVFPVQRFAEAYAALEDRQIVGKVVLTLDDA